MFDWMLNFLSHVPIGPEFIYFDKPVIFSMIIDEEQKKKMKLAL